MIFFNIVSSNLVLVYYMYFTKIWVKNVDIVNGNIVHNQCSMNYIMHDPKYPIRTLYI